MINLKLFTAFFLLTFLLGQSAIAQKQNKNSWVAPKYADDIKNPLKDDAAATMMGMKTFKNMCAICHGDTGKGNGVAGVTLHPKPADFLAINVKDETDGAIFWKMTEGNPPMASYKTLLTEEQRWQLVNYIRKLERTYKDKK
ncbi:MAG: cytochrome c [Lewinellaceae bacterium]|nr:cytochrome c [Lewinellaceae bacterium]